MSSAVCWLRLAAFFLFLLCFRAGPWTPPAQNEDICFLSGSAGTHRRRRRLGSRRQLAHTCRGRLLWQVSAAPNAFHAAIWPEEGVAQVASRAASAVARTDSEREENRRRGDVQADGLHVQADYGALTEHLVSVSARGANQIDFW